jgi:adenosine/AMP kinase
MLTARALQGMIDALIPVEIEQTKTVKKDKGFWARLGFKKQPVDPRGFLWKIH